MLTRCPHCQTSFRVSSEQLKLRQGQVRCGECLGVFNALESLSDEVGPVVLAPTEPKLPEPAVVMPEAMPVTLEEPEIASATEVDLEFDPVEEQVVVTEPELLIEPVIEPVIEHVTEPVIEPVIELPLEVAPEPVSLVVPEIGIVPAVITEPAPEVVPDAEILPEAWEAEAPPPPRRWPWVIGSLLSLLLAAGQLLFIYRIEVSVLVPESRPLLTEACDLLGCEMPRPRKPDLVGIETSDLAPEEKERLLLTATLKNRAPFAQEYPHLELTLTDARDNPILRKVLPPAEYLPSDHPADAGFAARHEVSIKLQLEAKGVPAIGYRLYLFYP